VRYDRDVRPIFADRCFRCHGPDEAKRREDLRLDVAAAATAARGSGRRAIVPGDPAASEVLRRVASADPDERMPPPESNRPALAPEEVALLERWIAEGARYEPHWSFVPPSRPAPPAVLDEAWCANPVDRFVLARLEAEGVRPSPEADRATLLRRVTLDLTGLPPTPEELERFLADGAPDAWDRVVERLLHEEPYASRFAERIAGPWLDAARYADTSGIHMDAGRQIWPWRDWVLAAFRDDMPFDRFLTEQLAGDLLPSPTRAQQVASGFNRNHVTSDEGGAIDAEYLVEYAVDRASTTASVFLGLTMGCARCHEHKFDPISQEEFYSFYAFFDSIEEPGVYSQEPDPDRAFEPFLEVPSSEQEAERERLATALASERESLDAAETDAEREQRRAFLAELATRTGLAWAPVEVRSAVSGEGATLTVRPDGSVLASGENPDVDEHTIVLSTEATGLSLLALHARTDPSLPSGRVGRAENGNAVLSGIEVEAVSLTDPARRERVALVWAWADVEQANGDFAVANALVPDELGWAVAAHQVEGDRVALFLAERPFGFEGGTEVRVRLVYRSIYARHALGCVRLDVASLDDAGRELLPLGAGAWQLVGPFPADDGTAAFDTAFGPEGEPRIDRSRNFGAGNQYWHHVEGLADGRANGGLPTGVNATYVGKRLLVPTARRADVSLGSDDGVRVFLDGTEVFANRVDRSLAPDQDAFALDLPAGEHALVLKVVNTGGQAGFAWRTAPRDGELAGDLLIAALPERARSDVRDTRLERAWRTAFSPGYRAATRRIEELEARQVELEAGIPRTMVMRELPEPRPTHVLLRGQYDHPDPDRPVRRGVPAALGRLPDDAPPDRLGLARWMAAPENPLVARVAVNRLWELVFGAGIVRTSEDFGMQGEWPSHPELLDWLAVEFREGGWDVKGLLATLVRSRTYRQSSRARPELAERDPENRWLARAPRRRLEAEAVRDQALFVSGLLVERFGGPSVKPYQPAGLWEEVAMVQSNTRTYERGEGEALWRRSLYTYWKRAAPPPSLLLFDAPTREFCTIRRPVTNTPLQALALWNDEQYVEAARALAARVLEGPGDDRARLAELLVRCTGRRGEPDEIERLAASLAAFRERYASAPDDAAGLLSVGEAPLPAGHDPAELAAWTLVASAVLNLDATITRS